MVGAVGLAPRSDFRPLLTASRSEVPVPHSSPVSARYGATPFLSTLTTAGHLEASVHVVGELDLVTSPQLRDTLGDAQLSRRRQTLETWTAGQWSLSRCAGARG